MGFVLARFRQELGEIQSVAGFLAGQFDRGMPHHGGSTQRESHNVERRLELAINMFSRVGRGFYS